MDTLVAVLLLCASLVTAQRSSGGSSTSGNGGFNSGSNSDRFGSGSGSDRFGSGSGSDRFGSGSGSDRFGSGSGSDRFGSNSGSSSDRFGSSGTGSDRTGSNSGSDRFGSSGSGSDRFGSNSGTSGDRFGSSGSRIPNPSVDSGSGSGNDWDSDEDQDTQRIQAWPGGIVPYTVGSDISDANARTLKQMLDDLTAQTCVQFVTRGRNDANYTMFKSGSVCSAPLGMSSHPTQDSGSSNSGSGSRSGSGSGRDNFGSSSRGGSNSGSGRGSSFSNGVSGASNVVLASSCFQTKRLARRLMNLLGIPHETSRPDRDQFVTINSNNIRSGYAKNLQQLSKNAYLPGVLDIPYDLQSVTQYSDTDIAKDKNTWAIKPKSSRSSVRDLGSDNFSKGDIQKINAAYNCRNSGSRGNTFGSSSGSRGRGSSGNF